MSMLRVFREECLSEFLPERQWAHIKKSSQHPEQTKMFVDLAFVVSWRPLRMTLFSIALRIAVFQTKTS